MNWTTKLILFLTLTCIIAACNSVNKKVVSKAGQLKILTHTNSQGTGFEKDLLTDFMNISKIPSIVVDSKNERSQINDFFNGDGKLLAISFKSIETTQNRVTLQSWGSGRKTKVYCYSSTAPLGDTGHIDVSYSCGIEKIENLIQQRTDKFSLFQIQINDQDKYIWLAKNVDHEFQISLKSWLTNYKTILKIAQINEKYFGHLGLFNKFDIYVLRKRHKSVLPRYRSLFSKNAKLFNLDPILLQAISYQESHWNSKAISHTGVKGLMMLTKATSKSLGVKDRLDPEQSIYGGAKYFMQMKKRIPASVVYPDREWFALAAYNVGLGHIYDARRLVVEEGKNQNHWHNVAQALPKLSHPEYYQRLKYGKARGKEPVNYVKKIRSFHMHLEQLEAKK